MNYKCKKCGAIKKVYVFNKHKVCDTCVHKERKENLKSLAVLGFLALLLCVTIGAAYA